MTNENRKEEERILLTGATGYVGGRLLKRLQQDGRLVRCMVRRPEYLSSEAEAGTKIVRGDVLDPKSLRGVFDGIDTAFYLIHSLSMAGDFDVLESQGACNFAEAADKAGVERIIYLSGLGTGSDLSPHLRSRQAVGRVLSESGVQTLEFRAGIIVGSGSVSFEMIRSLVDRLPIMITPRWANTLTQPIAIEDVIEYLAAAIDHPFEGSTVLEIGAPERVSYKDLMKEYGRQRGLNRLMIQVPVLTPRLSSLWLGLVTPVYARIGRKLVDGLRNETIMQDNRSLQIFSIRPRGIREAINRALYNEDYKFANTRWSDAVSSKGYSQTWGGARFGSRLVVTHRISVKTDDVQAFRIIERIGGDTGWYYGNWLWRIRGWLDLLMGGVGMRRGRKNPIYLNTGDALDFWRVEAIVPGQLLRLYAEMKLPGRSWLQFEVNNRGDESEIIQTTIFDPIGLFGLMYWYGLYPLHHVIFNGMLKGIGKALLKENTHAE